MISAVFCDSALMSVPVLPRIQAWIVTLSNADVADATLVAWAAVAGVAAPTGLAEEVGETVAAASEETTVGWGEGIAVAPQAARKARLAAAALPASSARRVSRR